MEAKQEKAANQKKIGELTVGDSIIITLLFLLAMERYFGSKMTRQGLGFEWSSLS